MRSMADALTLALKPKKVAINHTKLLPKGTKSNQSGSFTARTEGSKKPAMRGPASKAKPYLGEISKVDVNLRTASPEFHAGRIQYLIGAPHSAPSDVVKMARISQGIKSQSAGVEDHMNLQPPVKPSKYGEPVHAPDPYMDRALNRNFIAERKVDVNLKLQRLREETALRKRIQQLVNEGIVE
jgi:hypothetical protein